MPRHGTLRSPACALLLAASAAAGCSLDRVGFGTSRDAHFDDAGLDAGMFDAGIDAALDADRVDAGTDAGVLDGGPPDSGPPDTGPPDAPPDTGPPMCAPACRFDQICSGSSCVARPPSVVTVDAASYTVGTPIIVTYSGLTGSGDWIAIARDGAPMDQYGAYVNLPAGETSGSRPMPSAGLNGAYRIRAFWAWPGGGYTIRGESAVFTVMP